MCIYPAVAGSFETVVCVELYVFDPPFFCGGFVTSRSTDVRCMPGWVLVPGIYRLVHLSYHLSLHFSASIVGLLTRTECGGMGRVLSWFIYIFLSSLSVILLDGAAVGNGPASWQGKECISIYHK